MAFTDHVIIFITLVVFYSVTLIVWNKSCCNSCTFFSSSVSSEEYSVFVLTGGSVTLDIPTDELPQFNTLVWMKGKAENIVRFTREPRVIKPYSPYMDGMEFNTETFSPTLKNMQKTDSGIYRVRTTRENETDDIVYGVSVINAVESPVLTVVSNWSSIDFCTVIVTCRGQDLTLSSTYQIDSCSRVEMASSRIITLILHFTEYSIICNHSNPVSWKSETKILNNSVPFIKVNACPILTNAHTYFGD
ncbi:uncharacterized protein LOC127441221 [Myxocyprinus asiaticus]|uniref:uncharacterized protein LOC127441221 n=1 Tax=Myxocyprinus asiaticus TaxID=70543 RepID=UPI002221CA6F|nr:uncharacterized protein LOC127441221 [Myxocyprinus asiaticus]